MHSRNSCDGACATVRDLVADAEAKGITDFGLTDHLHTPATLPDIAASRAEYLDSDPSPRFHFGVEVSVVSRWELEEIAAGHQADQTYGLRGMEPPGAPFAIVLTAEHVAEYGIEYVVGGAHWPLGVPTERDAVIANYHHQNMFLATHPLITIVAHPWWWMGAWQDGDGRYRTKPWFDDFGVIPQSMHDEFAAAAVERGKVVEINLSANLLNAEYPAGFVFQYLEYLAALQAHGVALAIGSDVHEAHYAPDLERSAELLASVGLAEADRWCLAPRSSVVRDGRFVSSGRCSHA